MRLAFIGISTILAGLSFSGCLYRMDPDKEPGYEYAPQMYHALPLEPYREEVDKRPEHNPFNMNMRTPPAGTVARGKLDYFYPIENTNEGYERAATELKNPLEKNQKNMEIGQKKYMTFCYPCHGTTGQGDGPVISNFMDDDPSNDNKFPPPPAYTLDYRRTMPEGQIYHVVTVGRNAMPPYASQISPDDRWRIVMFVQQLQKLDDTTDEQVEAAATTADTSETINKSVEIMGQEPDTAGKE
ncbi:MAG: cytochrome c [Bacteroidia bacterium]